jgi:uncharacterized metal-binding protein
MNLIDLLKKAAKDPGQEVYSKICKVEEVDKTKRTLKATPLDGSAPILNARLQANRSGSSGVVQFPKIGSFVLVSFISEADAFVSLISEPEEVLIDCEKVVINGGEFGGLIKIKSLEAQIAKLNQNFVTLKTAIQAAPVVSGDGGAAFKTNLIAALQFNPADLSNVTNEKVKH